MSKEIKIVTPTNGIINLAVSIGSAMIGYHIHSSGFWAVMDFLFWPIAWIKWLICQEVSMSVIRQTFAFFFN